MACSWRGRGVIRTRRSEFFARLRGKSYAHPSTSWMLGPPAWIAPTFAGAVDLVDEAAGGFILHVRTQLRGPPSQTVMYSAGAPWYLCGRDRGALAP
jgi:hypothetical protein